MIFVVYIGNFLFKKRENERGGHWLTVSWKPKAFSKIFFFRSYSNRKEKCGVLHLCLRLLHIRSSAELTSPLLAPASPSSPSATPCPPPPQAPSPSVPHTLRSRCRNCCSSRGVPSSLSRTAAKTTAPMAGSRLGVRRRTSGASTTSSPRRSGRSRGSGGGGKGGG